MTVLVSVADSVATFSVPETWTSSSFLGISACFHDVDGKTARHAVLGIVQLEHPHTGKVIAEALVTCLEEW